MKTQTGYQVASKLLEHLTESKAYKATAYLSEKFVMKMTVKRHKGQMPKASDGMDIAFTIGKPNVDEREFIKKCKKVGEPFPVKKIQLKFVKKGK